MRLPMSFLTALVPAAASASADPVDDNWGLRTDARWFNGLGRHAGEHVRVYNGITLGAGRR